ncbi:unnamed protein product (macronuclear) [Paramecium tetraurelia]|uniref:DoxX family protein n=1 Tax=Paramecium tetraurelia TaxID=5888 RepID=A0C4T5_PARTE|nr:uncharacterized protein GSPATT00006301001 [Paramecium tetraurelia]CAK65802.1 unnamed protein product [Paramecium tetraurelia]|eukprot:XP_001433199.1 hypothetical protein (macronuclear) [Paramecium tetraurelia strain d4-2]
MSCCSLIGRVLLVIIFIGAGVDKFLQPHGSVGLLNARYPAFYKTLETSAKQFNVPLPVQISPTQIKQISQEIVYGVGGAEIILALFVILNQRWAGKLLSFLTLSFVAVIHNPFIHGTTQDEKLTESIQGLWTLGIAGALLIIGASSAQTCAATSQTKAEKPKQTAPAAPTKKAKRN